MSGDILLGFCFLVIIIQKVCHEHLSILMKRRLLRQTQITNLPLSLAVI